jgi:intein-encoded DNA endonuclease-like protein
MKPLQKVKTKWSPEFAYAIGLLVTDGNLSPDKRHITFTSKDLELINNFQKSLKINLHIGKKSSGSNTDKKYYVVQIGDILFYKFLMDIGLTPRKTKTIGAIKVPTKYFYDFLRGHFDGDGSFYSYWDPRWKSSFMFYTIFVSASKNHLNWLREAIFNLVKIRGHITKSVNESTYQLKYAKTESLKLLPKLYYDGRVVCLTRKRLKIERAIRTNSEK